MPPAVAPPAWSAGGARGQAEGVVKPLDAWLLMELGFGAFVGMMRAHWEGRLRADAAAIAGAEQACWDAIAAR